VSLPTLLADWKSIHAVGPDSVGGKGWQLARLATYGLPVPAALVIPAEVERAWLAGCELPSADEDPSDPTGRETLDRFHRLLLAKALPEPFTHAMQTALAEKGWLDRPLAVRSSATVEDSKTASFAGIHLTRLNIVGPQAVAQAVREVWSSRWQPQAVAYRRRAGLERSALSMAVVIMPLLPVEVTPYPLSVYDWFNSRRLINLMLERPQVMARYPLQPAVQRAALFNGFLYLNLSLLQWELHDAYGLPPKTVNALIGGHQPEIEVAGSSLGQRVTRLPRLLRLMLRSKGLRRRADKIVESVHELAKQWRQQPLPEEEAALLAQLRQLVRTTRKQESLFFLQTSSGGSLSALANLLEARLPGEGHTLTAALLAGGEPSVTAKQAYALAALARIARHDRPTREWLADARRNNDWRHRLPAEHPFRAAFEDFLERYGHRGVYETYFRHPRWREEPGYLLDTIRDLMDQDMQTLQRQQRHAAEQAREKARRHLPFWQRPLLHSLIKAATQESNQREAARSALVALMEPQRRILLRIAERWRDRGMLQDPHAIFELCLPELQSCIDGELPPKGIIARLADRQRQLAIWQTGAVAKVLLEQADTPCKTLDAEPTQTTDDGWFQGMAVGTGRASGTVRILRSPTEGGRLQPGEVLAAPSTDPSWTPLFLKAGALIMETGGYLSHGAIVAREFAIPAVVNLPGILDRLAEGEEVEVDGHLGRIRRLKADVSNY
jgi:pyruvate,water dikinase